MTPNEIEQIRRVEPYAAAAWQQLDRWRDSDDETARRLAGWYGARWVELAATHPSLQHLVDDADLEAFGDVLDEPFAVARRAHLEALEVQRQLRFRSQYENVDDALAHVEVEIEVAWTRVREAAARRTLKTLRRKDSGRGWYEEDAAHFAARRASVLAKARRDGLDKAELDRIARVGVVK